MAQTHEIAREDLVTIENLIDHLSNLAPDEFSKEELLQIEGEKKSVIEQENYRLWGMLFVGLNVS